MIKKLVIIALIAVIYFPGLTQDTLPNFILENLGKNRIRVGWINPYGESCVQLNVQRSFDSTKNFRTIFSTPSPELPQNGFIDTKITSDNMFYRIFYVLNGGAYYFSKSKRPSFGFISDSIVQKTETLDVITVQIKDNVYRKFNKVQFKAFRDSVQNQTKDSLIAGTGDIIILKHPIITGAWMPSPYIYTTKNGFVAINLPKAKDNKYSIIFFDSDNKEIFTIKHVNFTELTLDKANFLHGGWFYFELYEDDKLKEKNKFYLQKEF